MTDRPLTPAIRRDILESLSFALRYSRAGKRVAERDVLTANAAAEHLVDALERSGFVVMKAPPAPDHTAPMPDHGQSNNERQPGVRLDR